jgi:hypothetical protein
VSSIMSILQSAYAAAPQPLFAPGTKFATNVDPSQWQGTWTGKDYNNQPVTFSITKVSGYRANVTFQSASGMQYQKVFIAANNSFRIGNSSFTLTGNGVAEIKTVVTNPNNGTQTLQTAYVNQQK